MSGRPFRFGIAFQSNKTPSEYQALADQVDRYGFDVVSVYNDLLFQPALGPLLLMAPRLRRAQVGAAALNPYTVHPLEIAGQTALLDLVSGGRAYLGLVRGAWLDRLGIEPVRPRQTLREAVELVRHLLRRDSRAYEGQVFQLAANTCLQYEPVRPAVPIMIGTWGKETARVAGQVADEVKIGGSTNGAMVQALRPFIAEGARQAERAEDAVGVCLGAVTVVDEDRERARALARQEVALYLPVVAPLDPSTDPEWLARLRTAERDQGAAGVADLITDEVLERFAFAGNPADVIRQVERIIHAGAARVEFGTPHGTHPPTAIRLLGEQVLPYFQTSAR